jgi:uncharacterized membrane protein
MLASGMLFAVLAGMSAAAWTVCLKLGATKVNVALGAMTVTAVAFVVNSIVLLTMRARGQEIVVRPEALWLLVVAGVAAAGVDIFALTAYERGLRVSSSLVIGATSTALVLLVGVITFQDPLTPARVAGIGLIAAGVFLLQAQGG